MTNVLRLPKALAAYGTADFITTLKREICTYSVIRATLARTVSSFGSIEEPITAMVLGVDDRGGSIEARITLLYTLSETVYHCPDCSGEDAIQGTCAMTIQIDKITAVTTFLFHPEVT